MSMMLAYFVDLNDTRLLYDLGNRKPFLMVVVVIGVGLFNEVALSGSLLYFIYQRRSGFHESDSILKRIAWLISSSAVIIVIYGTICVLAICISPHSFGNLALQMNASKCKLSPLQCFSLYITNDDF